MAKSRTVGACLRNEKTLRAGDRSLLEAGRMNGFVAMWYQNPEELRGLGIDPSRCAVRLPDSEHAIWENGRIVRKEIYGWEEYVEECVRTIERFYPYGYRAFGLDNEPNLVWPWHRSHRGDAMGAGDYAAFAADVVPRLRARMPRDARLGLTPMSHPSLSPQWLSELRLKRVVDPRDGVTKTLIFLFDEVWAHCYWQAASDMEAHWAGREYRWLRTYTGLPVRITEAGNSSCHKNPVPPYSELERLMREQYPRYAEKITEWYVEGLYFFTLGHDGGWAGFDISLEVCRAIATRAEEGRGPAGPSLPNNRYPI